MKKIILILGLIFVFILFIVNNGKADRIPKDFPISEATDMPTKHSFLGRGDFSLWEGWYLDGECVGTDFMLEYDSVGPSTIKLTLITKELTVNLEDSDAVEKIADFMNPLDGFKRFNKSYEECLDSVYEEYYGPIKFMGRVSFEADYADKSTHNARKLNRFICELTGISGSLHAFSGENNIESFSDHLAQNKFQNWKSTGNFSFGFNEAVIVIKPRIINERYVTFSKFEYIEEDNSRGWYTETFHTFNIEQGNELCNEDIFIGYYGEDIKKKLFEVMSNDPHYQFWQGNILPSEIENRIIAWQTPGMSLSDFEEDENLNLKLELPNGALTDKGVLFSFQPYEIETGAAGTFHFLVPYNELNPYLTMEAKRLIEFNE